MATINLLRAANGSVAVTAAHDAAVFHSALGNRILKGIYKDMKVSLSGSTITVLAGMAVYGGRQVEIPSGTTVTLNVSELMSGSNIYVMLKIVISSDGNSDSAEIYATASNENTNTSPVDGVGTHKISIARYVRISASSFISVRPAMQTIEPGHALSAYALLSSGSIGGVPVTNIFLSDFSGAKYAKEADVASEARGFQGGTINTVNSNLYMPNRKVYLAGYTVLVKESSITIAAGGTTTKTIPSIGTGNVFLDVIVGLNDGRKAGNWEFAQKLESGTPEFTWSGVKWTFNFGTSSVTITNSGSSAVTLTKPFIAAMIGVGR